MARPKPIAHGTRAGYEAHAYRGEYACKPCTDANTAYAREREARTGGRDRKRARARLRALKRLAALHAEQFSALLQEEVSRG